MPLSFLAQIKANELKSMCDCKQDEGEPEGFYTREKHSSVKKKQKKQPTAGIQGPFKKPPPTFFHYLGLQDDSQSLCTVAVQKKEKNLSLIFSPSFLHCGEPAASFHLYLCSLHRTASMLSRIRAGPLASPGIIFVLFFVFFANNIQ